MLRQLSQHVLTTLQNAVILNMPRPKVMSIDVLADTINVQLNHNSILADNGGATPEIVRVIGDTFSEGHYDALIDSATWTVSSGGSFIDSSTTTSTLASPVLSVPNTDAVYTISLAVNGNTYNGAGTLTAVFGLQVLNGVIHRQFVVAADLADTTTATAFDFSNESQLVNEVATSYRWRYDTSGTPVSDTTEDGNHDFSTAATYVCDYSQEWSGNGAIGTYYSQFTIELV